MLAGYFAWGLFITERNDSRDVWVRFLMGPGAGLGAALICGAVLIVWRRLRRNSDKSASRTSL